MNKWMPIAFLLILFAGLMLRVPKLADRPLHHDEANQAYRFGILLEEGTYNYDADDHHGPTLYYLTLPIAKLTGVKTFAETSEFTYRIIPVIFGMLLMLLIPLLRSGIGCIAVLITALLTAISPAMAYYSRFYIQEILLVAFTLLAIGSGWLSVQSGSRRWAMLCGVALGLMFATKETAVISYAAMIGSIIICAFLAHIRHFPLKNIGLALLFAGVIAFVLFSSFFTNMDGPLESILAFKGYVSRGSGIETDHVQPWNYFLRILTVYRFDGGPRWSEGLAFGLGLVGCGAIVLKKIPGNCDLGLARFLMFYTLLLMTAYSVLSYKTPWCILSFLHGWILLAAIGVASLFAGCSGNITNRKTALIVRMALVAALAIPVFTTYRLAQRTVFRYAADYRNPYVYAHTSPDFKNLVKRIHELEAVSPDGNKMYIQVIAKPDSTWPLPFYLRKFPNIGYWTYAREVPGRIKPSIIITPADFEADPDAYLSEYYGLRPDTLLAVHIDRPLWDAFIETRK
ncbi:TIGR03663 family protein [Pontiellaceae bacterium B12227]|nr:TIGR03663 family protein [Pontiellaceae bacterium B12227]